MDDTDYSSMSVFKHQQILRAKILKDLRLRQHDWDRDERPLADDWENCVEEYLSSDVSPNHYHDIEHDDIRDQSDDDDTFLAIDNVTSHTIHCNDSQDWEVVPEQDELAKMIDDEFEVIGNSDLIEATAEYIAKSMAKLPGRRPLPARAVLSVLLAIFGDIRYCGAIGSVWGWGTLFYTAYIWSKYAMEINRKPVSADVVNALGSIGNWTRR